MIFRLGKNHETTQKICRRYNIKFVLFSFHRFTTASGQIAAGYQPQKVEGDKHLKWFNKKEVEDPFRKSVGDFRMILPPPNVTGNLHLGHALMATVQDVICRRKRQLDYDVTWIPGTDHAGIATQVVVEKKVLKDRRLTRHQLGRDEFLKEVWKWKDEKGGSIIGDLKRLGCLLNWDKEYFTMDKRQENAVNSAFVTLFDQGLIKRKKSLVNWSCNLESAISDIEVDSVEVNGPTELSVPGYTQKIPFGRIYNIAYQVWNSTTNEEIIVSTTRPETMLGDVAVAVHPDDQRYQKFINEEIKLWHPFRNEPIPLIADKAVDMKFGTGAVKITPAHDRDDFEMANRHSLEPIQVFTEQGKIVNSFQTFADLPRFEARKKLLKAIVDTNLLREIRPHAMTLPVCSRSKDIIEYMLRPQWFLECQIMAIVAMQAVRSGKIKLHPKNFETEWFRWLSDCRDWCISRQLWWGHQIPAYLAKTETNEEMWFAAVSPEAAAEKARCKLKTDNFTLTRDTDVLDTWFSSALLPFSTFGWPDQAFKSAYPLDLMETGHDILFFWVARMVMMGIKLTGEVPFKNILLNGMICDAHGRKMSKSLGNIVTPLQVIQGASLESLQKDVKDSFLSGYFNPDEMKKSVTGLAKMFPNGIPECGTDALRLTLCSHNIKNHFINFDVNECHTNKLFLNKIWQATRYTLAATEKFNLSTDDVALDILDSIETLNLLEFSRMDRWILSRLANTMQVCEQSLENYNFHTAVAALKTFFYGNFCDVYLETTKPAITNETYKAPIHCKTLTTCLSLGLQMMSPFTPFIADELLQHLPLVDLKFNIKQFADQTLEDEIVEILKICETIRHLKSTNKITKKHCPELHLFAPNAKKFQLLTSYTEEILTLTQSSEICVNSKKSELPVQLNLYENFTVFSTAGHLCSFGIATNDEYRKDEDERNKISDANRRKLEKLETELARHLERTSNDGYRKSASNVIQKRHLEKIEQLKTEIENIKAIRN